ncbi:MAG: hypothetical protein Q9165_008445 [Trypethelium subeluteriae]
MAPRLGTKRAVKTAPKVSDKKRRIAGPDPKQASVVQLLGQGVTGAVFRRKQDIAIKEFVNDPSIDRDFKSFKAEKDAFEIFQDIEGLRGRISAYFGEQVAITTDSKGDSSRKALGLEFVEGETLFSRQQRNGLMYGELGKIWETLKVTLRILHEAGVTHNDTHSKNVMIRCSALDTARPVEECVVLIDFSHSEISSKLPAGRSWQKMKEADHKQLEISMKKMANLRVCTQNPGALILQWRSTRTYKKKQPKKKRT